MEVVFGQVQDPQQPGRFLSGCFVAVGSASLKTEKALPSQGGWFGAAGEPLRVGFRRNCPS